MLHLHLPERTRIKADTRAFKAAREDTHRLLRMEIEEERLSRQITDRHNEKVRERAAYRQNGGV